MFLAERYPQDRSRPSAPPPAPPMLRTSSPQVPIPLLVMSNRQQKITPLAKKPLEKSLRGYVFLGPPYLSFQILGITRGQPTKNGQKAKKEMRR
jgi:hypothetical protein